MGAEERAFYKARGVRLLEGFPGGAVAVKVEQRCQHLTSAGQCAIYGTPDRPGGCEAFPTYEFELIGVEGCSYEFAEV